MATVTAAERPIVNHARRDALVVLWEGLTTTNDVGSPFEWVQGADRSAQAVGTIGTGGHVKIEGSNETTPTTWAVLTDPQGSALDFDATGLAQISELTRWVRPHVTAGDGTTDMDVYILFSAPRR